MYTKERTAANLTVWYKDGHMVAEQYNGQLPCLYVDDMPRIYGAYHKDKFAKALCKVYGLAAAWDFIDADIIADTLVDLSYMVDAIVDSANIIPAAYYFNVIDVEMRKIQYNLRYADGPDLRVMCKEALASLLPIMDELKNRLNG